MTTPRAAAKPPKNENAYKKKGNKKMTMYCVINNETGYYEEFFNLTAAKKAMKENNAKGSKWKIYSDGECVDLGEIKLKGSNKAFIANSPRNMKKANY